MRSRRLSDESGMVLQLFADLHRMDPSVGIFGRQIIKGAGIKSGSLYPILHRFQERGLLLSEWDELDVAIEERRRPRCQYRLNPLEAETADRLLDEWRKHAADGGKALRRIRSLKAELGFT